MKAAAQTLLLLICFTVALSVIFLTKTYYRSEVAMEGTVSNIDVPKISSVSGQQLKVSTLYWKLEQLKQAQFPSQDEEVIAGADKPCQAQKHTEETDPLFAPLVQRAATFM